MNRDPLTAMEAEIDSRISRLENHGDDPIDQKNQYAALTQAVSRIINQALLGELKDLKSYLKELRD